MFRLGEWTIEVMKAARTTIFEPEVGQRVTHTHSVSSSIILCYAVDAGGLSGQECADLWTVLGKAWLQ